MSEGSSPPASLPDDDDLLREILLRLPPLPSSLPRAALVCRRWLRLVSDPRFAARFRARHHRTPPLLGFFFESAMGPIFVPTLDPPNRIPPTRFSLPELPDADWSFHGCRHGLALLLDLTRLEWKMNDGDICNGAVLRATGDHGSGHVRSDCRSGHFKVVLICSSEEHTLACLYESESEEWGSTCSIAISSLQDFSLPNVLAGNALYWLVNFYGGILEFDFCSQNLSMIQMPEDAGNTFGSLFHILRTEDRALGLAVLSKHSIHLWGWKAGSDGTFRWLLQKTVELDKFLSLTPSILDWETRIPGFDEDSNVIFLSMPIGVFMIHLESMQSMKILEDGWTRSMYPYTSFYTTVGGGGDRAEMLNNT
ncbi:hypothetical protein ACP70R_028271 [Stipagrostis hirtigluma subsp. patula]